MKEMTDQELTDKISQVFDDFEDPSAEQGWQELRKKYPEKHTGPVLMWWGAAAAVLLIICGIWFFAPDTKVGELAGDKPLGQPKSDSYSGRAEAVKKEQPAISDNPARGKAASTQDKLPATAYTPAGTDRTSRPGLDSKMVSAQTLSMGGNSPGQTPLVTLPQPAKPELNNADIAAERDSAISVAARLLALARPTAANDDHLHNVEEQPYASQKTASKNNMISFYAGSFVNYALGSETRVNFGAGFTSDIKLGNNLRLSTGLALANNSLSYNNGVPSSGKEKLSFDLQPSFIGGGNNNLTTVTKYDASLLALDIPLNIKYLLIPENNTLYMLAGLSSGTYLNEKYSLSYKKYNPAGFYAGQDQGSTVEANFQAFDFARTLNISFGYSTNLGKTQNITIEPFLKYPLGGLGSENLRFGSTGLNIKLNFSSLKK